MNSILAVFRDTQQKPISPILTENIQEEAILWLYKGKQGLRYRGARGQTDPSIFVKYLIAPIDFNKLKRFWENEDNLTPRFESIAEALGKKWVGGMTLCSKTLIFYWLG